MKEHQFRDLLKKCKKPMSIEVHYPAVPGQTTHFVMLRSARPCFVVGWSKKAISTAMIDRARGNKSAQTKAEKYRHWMYRWLNRG